MCGEEDVAAIRCPCLPPTRFPGDVQHFISRGNVTNWPTRVWRTNSNIFRTLLVKRDKLHGDTTGTLCSVTSMASLFILRSGKFILCKTPHYIVNKENRKYSLYSQYKFQRFHEVPLPVYSLERRKHGHRRSRQCSISDRSTCWIRQASRAAWFSGDQGPLQNPHPE